MIRLAPDAIAGKPIRGGPPWSRVSVADRFAVEMVTAVERPTSVTLFDANGRSGAHDFDLTFDDRLVGLEVTRHPNIPFKGLTGALNGWDPALVPASQAWSALLDPRVKLTILKRDAKLIAAALGRLSSATTQREAERELKVEWGLRVFPRTPLSARSPGLYLHADASGAAFVESVEHLSAAVSEALRRKGHQISRMQRAERWLAVFVDHETPAPLLQLDRETEATLDVDIGPADRVVVTGPNGRGFGLILEVGRSMRVQTIPLSRFWPGGSSD